MPLLYETTGVIEVDDQFYGSIASLLAPDDDWSASDDAFDDATFDADSTERQQVIVASLSRLRADLSLEYERLLEALFEMRER